MSSIGFSCKGLQIFLPISPTILLHYYDNSCYKTGDKKSLTVKITEQRDMDSLNLLQYVNASENIYYSDAQKSRVKSLKSAASLRPVTKTKISTHTNWETDRQRSELWVSSKQSNKINMALSCIKTLTKAQEFVNGLSTQKSHPALFLRDPYLMKLDNEYRQALKDGKTTGHFYEYLREQEA